MLYEVITERLQQVASPVEEIDLAHLKHFLIDPGDLPGVTGVFVPGDGPDHVTNQPATR